MRKTAITELLGIQYPILQGGMAWVAESTLAAAVSNAGGLGILAAANAPYEYVKEQIKKVKEQTDKPFGLNIMLLSPYAADIAHLAVQEQIPVVTTGAGNPGPYMAMWKDAGIRVIPVVASVAMAKMMQRSGADAVIAEGCESGGHVGETTTMALVPQVADAVEIPVIAAGGIGDGRGFAAAMMLGAQGVQMGTRFLAAKECVIHQNYKDRVLRAKDIDTVVTGRSTGHPVRTLRNKMTREYLRMEKEGCSFDELEALTIGGLRRAVLEGDADQGSMMSGQIAGLVKKEQTCREILEEVMAQAEELLHG